MICPRDLAATPINATDTLLQEQGTLSGSGGIVMDNGLGSGYRIVFRSSGILYFGASNIKFLPASRNTARGSMVCISLQGRARVIPITDACPS